MANIVGFTGTRHGMTDVQATVLEGFLRPMAEFHHGSCKGADVEAARIVRRTFAHPVRIIAHPGPDDDQCRDESGVDDETLPGLTHFARNRDIVDQCDELIACPREPTEQPKGGTWYTIRYARKRGVKVTVIWPDGSFMPIPAGC